MPKEVARYVGKWKPRTALAADHVALVKKIARSRRPQSMTAAAKWLSVMADFIGVLASSGMSLNAGSSLRDVFTDSALASYEQHLRQREGAGALTAGSRRTKLSSVLAFARDLDASSDYLNTGGHTRRTEPATDPMPDAAFAQWARLADLQSPAIAPQLKALLYCSRGAGLDGTDMRYVRGTSIRSRPDGAVVIDVPGPNKRIAIVLDRYGAPLLEAARQIGDGLCVGAWPHRNNPTSDLVNSLRGGQDLPRPMPRPLRRAYVMEMLQIPDLPVVRLFDQLGRGSLSEIESALAQIPRYLFDDTPLRSEARRAE